MNIKTIIKKNQFLFVFVAVMTIFKIIMAGLFSSDYQNRLFMPFIQSFLNGGNPYTHFYDAGITDAFPYPPVMLLVVSIGGLLSEYLSFDILFLKNLFFKLPLLFFDIAMLIFLNKMFPKKEKTLTCLYYSSPIVIYAVYMHGQLDIVPMTFIIAAMYFLFGKTKYDDIGFIVLTAFAILSKQSILAVTPLLFYYYFRRKKTMKTVLSVILFLTVVIGFIVPFLNDGFINMVLFNKVQNSVTNVYITFSSLHLYPSIFAIAAIYIHILSINKIGRDLTFSFCGIIFAVFLIFVSPMPGWFVWIVPFVSVIAIGKKHKKTKFAQYFILNGMYLLYFMFCHKTQMTDLYFLDSSLDFIKTDNVYLKNAVFTVLSASLMFMIMMIYRYGIGNNAMYKRRNLPFTIGISGDSGTGKSSLNSILSETFGNENILLIEGDGDHKWQRGEKQWETYTHLNPKANFLYRQARDIATLRNGETVERVDYDHKSGTFTPSRTIIPKRYIVISGLHSLYLPQMRKNIDLKIFLDTDEKLRVFWKTRRDTGKRGYSPEAIREQIRSRQPDFKKYIAPQRDYANLIIEYYDKELGDDFEADYQEKISMKITLSSEINIEPLLQRLEQYDIRTDYDFCDDPDMQTILIDGASLDDKSDVPFRQIAEDIIHNFDELAPDFRQSDRVHNNILQIMILIMIDKMMESGM